MKKILKPDMMAAQAISLRQVADDLQNNLNQMLKLSAQPFTGSKEQMARGLGYLLSTVMLRALAAELILKALSCKKTGQYKKGKDGHDLLALFNDLDSSTKTIVAKLEDNHGIAPLEKILEKHRNDFVAWRYLAEAKTQNVGVLDLDKALTVLRNVYQHVDFRKSLKPAGPVAS